MHEAQEQRPQLRLRTTALSSSVTASSSQASLEQRQPSQRQPLQSCKRVAVQPDVDQHKAELHGRGYTIVSHQFSRQRCRQLLSAAARENYDGSPIFNGEASGEPRKRFVARSESWAAPAEREIARALDEHGLLGARTVGDMHALKSEPCEADTTAAGVTAAGVTAAEAALRGRQPAHQDAPEPTANERRQHGLKPLAALADDDMPLSVMVAVQEGTVLWIFPGGCDATQLEHAFLVHLEVGAMLVWRGDLVHAGAGYAIQHYRLHA